jgi:hypothetical protein
MHLDVAMFIHPGAPESRSSEQLSSFFSVAEVSKILVYGTLSTPEAILLSLSQNVVKDVGMSP